MTSGEVSPFTSVLPGCASGTVTDGTTHVELLPVHGMFTGFKVFTCAGGTGGLVVHVAGLRESGTLVGIPFDGGIEDHYRG
jgi:hypothetical protein